MKAERILVPVDFSEPARAALLEADRIASEGGGTLTLVHVHQISAAAVADFTYVEPPDKIAHVCEAAEELLQKWRLDLNTPIERCRVVVLTGSPVAEIIGASADYDLIVMATHGRTGLSHFLMGSVAERVVQGAHCSVLIVKPQKTVDANAGG